MNFQINDISPARIAALILILYAARYGKEAYGTVVGVSVGFAVFLADTDLITMAVAFAFGGLIGGMFSPLGKLGVGFGFFMTNGIIVMQSNHALLLPFLYEVIAATVIFILLPNKINHLFARLFSPAPEHSLVEGLRNSMVMRLEFASQAVKDVSQTVEAVSARLKKTGTPSFERIFDKTEQDACRSCSMRIYCWESNRGETLSSLLSVTKKIRKSGIATIEDLPNPFFRSCLHLNHVLEALSANFNEFLAKDAAERRLSEIRNVIAEQFEGVSEMLSELSLEFRDSHRYDYALATDIRNALISLELSPLDISCRIDQYDRLTAEIRLDANDTPHVNRAALLRVLSEKCQRDFEVPTITDTGNSILLTLSEKAIYGVDFGMAQLCFQDNKLCGDACQHFFDGRGRFVTIISDGMGKGGRAAVDGTMASGLMARLLKAGFEPNSALKIVNSAMLYKSTDESLATIDVTILDLFSGTAEFYKAGAPATLLRKNGKAGIAEGATLPAGILQGVSFDRTVTTLSKGDIIVMMSDGAQNDGADWIGVELEVWNRGSAKELAEHLADYARRRCSDRHGDDITVAVAILEKGY
jgi:stage II sporulation protein E